MNPDTITRGQRVTITTVITGQVIGTQTAGCTHGLNRPGQPPTTSHGSAPCPDRNRIIGLMLRLGSGRVTWLYLTGDPDRSVTIEGADR